MEPNIFRLKIGEVLFTLETKGKTTVQINSVYMHKHFRGTGLLSPAIKELTKVLYHDVLVKITPEFQIDQLHRHLHEAFEKCGFKPIQSDENILFYDKTLNFLQHKNYETC